MVIRKIIDNIRIYFVIASGLFVLSVAWTAFLLPHQISGSGVTGIGAIVFYATGIPMGYTYFAINVLLMIVALKSLGTSFGTKHTGLCFLLYAYSLQPLIPRGGQGKFMSVSGCSYTATV